MAGTAQDEAKDQSEKKNADGVIPIEKFEAPAFARKFLCVGPGSPAEHGDDAKDYGQRIALQNEHLGSLKSSATQKG
jgi:hypothetical protein